MHGLSGSKTIASGDRDRHGLSGINGSILVYFVKTAAAIN